MRWDYVPATGDGHAPFRSEIMSAHGEAALAGAAAEATLEAQRSGLVEMFGRTATETSRGQIDHRECVALNCPCVRTQARLCRGAKLLLVALRLRRSVSVVSVSLELGLKMGFFVVDALARFLPALTVCAPDCKCVQASDGDRVLVYP